MESMYRALIQPEVLADNNKKTWKMKIPLRNKIFAWYLRRRVILTKDNLPRGIDMEIHNVFFVLMMRQ